MYHWHPYEMQAFVSGLLCGLIVTVPTMVRLYRARRR